MKSIHLLVLLFLASSDAFRRLCNPEIFKGKRCPRFDASSSSIPIGKRNFVVASSVPLEGESTNEVKSPVSVPGDSVEESLIRNCKHYYTKAMELYNRLRNKEQRNELVALFFAGMRILGSRIVRSIRDDGDKGKRGEEWVLMEVFVCSYFFFGLPDPINKFVRFCGAFSIVFGFYTFCRAMWTLKDSISPFVTPIYDNILVTSGVYALVRHPMYCGVLFFTAGVSTFYDCVDKAIVTIILAVLLDKKADEEEVLLEKLHGKEYGDYVSRTKKIIPFLY